MEIAILRSLHQKEKPHDVEDTTFFTGIFQLSGILEMIRNSFSSISNDVCVVLLKKPMNSSKTGKLGSYSWKLLWDVLTNVQLILEH